MLIPTKRLLLCFAVLAPLWLIPMGTLLGFWGLLFLFLVALLDVFTLPRRRDLALIRRLPQAFYVGERTTVAIEVTNVSRSFISSQLCDDIPKSLGYSSDLQTLHLEPKQCCRLEWSILPERRGKAVFGLTIWRTSGLLGLWHKEVKVDLSQEIAIYPKLQQSSKARILAMAAQNYTGKRQAIQSQGEIDHLRAMHEGDEWRHVDWKYSARKNRWIIREHREESSCPVALFLDCGRTMGEPVGQCSRLDHAINASLQLYRIAQNNSGTFSLTAFSDRVETQVTLSPRGPFQRALHAVHALQPRAVESDYWKVFGQALSSIKKRSLIVLFSDILDANASKGMISQLCSAAQKHVVLCCMLKDASQVAALTDADPYKRAAAQYLSVNRAVALSKMRQQGVITVEVEPEHFQVRVLQKYLELLGCA
jgi:uncharacterized protein (DUF58 family)